MGMSIKSSEVSQATQVTQNTSNVQSMNHTVKPMTTSEGISTPERNIPVVKEGVSEKNALAEKTLIPEKKVLSEPKATHKNMEHEDKENKQMKQLIAEIEKSSGKIEVENTGLEFSIHEGTNRIMIRVINEETKEVVREVPGEKVLNAIAKIIDLSGIFVDEKR